MVEKNQSFKDRLNSWGKERKAFFFLIDFELKKPFVCELNKLEEEDIFIQTPEFNNILEHKSQALNDFEITPISFQTYKKAIEYVKREIKYGNSYLVNLTFPTEIKTKNRLIDIFVAANSPYKLFFKNEFVSFSPEIFIKIINNEIFSYPMKGTIDARIDNARQKILDNEKEMNEHHTIVDLIRNDLSMVASHVEVPRFRYLQEIKTNRKPLIQVSSEIKGILEKNWHERIGDILFRLLPAGSISGAPKKKTVEIIQNAEKGFRGYYTGIFGIFDGYKLNSAVNIRYIENQENKLIYRSGGGITALSNPKEEYNELIDKIYVPLGGNYQN
jgi:para-aminobenzoate synthetase component 1